MPPHTGQNIIHSSLTTPDFVLSASDLASTEDLKRGQSVSVMVQCDSAEEIKSTFEKFSVGGKVTQPLMESFWGATFGHLIDQYGITWMFNHEKA